MINFTSLELIEISDAISAALDRALAGGDPEGHEKRYGMLTVLHEAQSKILPVAFISGSTKRHGGQRERGR